MATEKRLIDANALVEKFWQDECRTQTRRDFVAMVNYAPTVDAVEVVRCKDCKHWNEEIGFCDEHSHFFNSGMCWDMFDENDFCSYGERKDDG